MKNRRLFLTLFCLSVEMVCEGMGGSDIIRPLPRHHDNVFAGYVPSCFGVSVSIAKTLPISDEERVEMLQYERSVTLAKYAEVVLGCRKCSHFFTGPTNGVLTCAGGCKYNKKSTEVLFCFYDWRQIYLTHSGYLTMHDTEIKSPDFPHFTRKSLPFFSLEDLGLPHDCDYMEPDILLNKK